MGDVVRVLREAQAVGPLVVPFWAYCLGILVVSAVASYAILYPFFLWLFSRDIR